jgi:NADH-quinone oxidoreductase subunit M
LGSYQVRPLYALLAGTGTILGAWYSLRLYRSVMLGAAHHPDTSGLKDLGPRETLMFVLLAAGVLWLGLQPQWLLTTLEGSSRAIVSHTTAPGGD